MCCLFSWGSVSSTVLASLPFSRRHSNLPFHFSAILFRLRVSATGVTLHVHALRPGTMAGIDKNKNLMINPALYYAVLCH
jgi:hypothetical protein